MKVVFLDIDGVLNSHAFLSRGTLRAGLTFASDEWWAEMLDPAAVALLNGLLERTGADVVVSSTWRIGCGPAALQRVLGMRGFAGRVVDVTPRLTYVGEGEQFRRAQRGDEIATWLAEHPGVRAFVVLDDNSDMAGVADHLVQTDYDLGLTAAHVERAVAELGGGQP